MRTRRQWIMASAVLLVCVMVAAAAWTRSAAEEAKAGPKKAPAFTLEDVDGKKVGLADFAGKIVVLEWANPECPIWLRVHKAGIFKALAEKYKDKGVVWLAINSTHTSNVEKNRKFAEAEKLPYSYLDDHAGDVGRAYDAKTTPHMFVICNRGGLAYQGAIDDDPSGKKEKRVNYVEQALEELLAGKAVSVPETKPYGCTVKYAPNK